MIVKVKGGAEKWFRTDEIEEFIGALEFSAAQARESVKDVARIKWLIIALHNAVQGACVCALRTRDTAGPWILDKKSGKELLHWLQVDSLKLPKPPRPREHMAIMTELFKRVQKKEYLKESWLDASPEMIYDITKLNELRNHFIHFSLHGLSIQNSGLPRVVEHSCEVIEHLYLAGGGFQFRVSKGGNARVLRSLKKIRESMRQFKLR